MAIRKKKQSIKCDHCGNKFRPHIRGRPPRFCSQACRQRNHELLKAYEHAELIQILDPGKEMLPWMREVARRNARADLRLHRRMERGESMHEPALKALGRDVDRSEVQELIRMEVRRMLGPVIDKKPKRPELRLVKKDDEEPD